MAVSSTLPTRSRVVRFADAIAEVRSVDVDESEAAAVLRNLVSQCGSSAPNSIMDSDKPGVPRKGILRRSSRLQPSAEVVVSTAPSPSTGPAPITILQQGDKVEFFVKWRTPEVATAAAAMVCPRLNPGKRKEPMRHLSPGANAAATSSPPKRMRAEGETQSKAQQDPHRSAARGKAIARPPSPPAKRKKVVEVISDSYEEDVPEGEESMGMAEKEQSWSRGHATASAEHDSAGNTEDAIEALQPMQKAKVEGSSAMKKPIELDTQGQPFGAMKTVFENDIKKYAKDLNPTTGWEGQPRHERRRLFERLYSDWQMCGDSDRVCEKWMQPIITKVLINVRWRINQFIDANLPRPADVHPTIFKKLQAMRATEVAQAKSEQMRSISKGKGSTAAQMKAIEREVVSRLTMLLNRPPYDQEVDAEVEKEFQRVQEQKRKARPDYNRDIEAVRARVSDLEDSVTRMGKNMATSHERLEAMMREILGAKGLQQSMASGSNANPTSSTELVNTSALTACGREAWKLVQQDSVRPPDVPAADLPSVVVEDVSEDIGVQKNITNDIVVIGDEEDTELVQDGANANSVEDHDGDEDVYAIDGSATGEPAVCEMQPAVDNTPTEENVEVATEVVGRPRRAVKSTQAAKVVKPAAKTTVGAFVAPKTISVPKAPEIIEKAGNTKKADNTRKKG